MKRIRWGDVNAAAELDALPFAGETMFKSAEERVRPILDNVRQHGDTALREYTKTFDFVDLSPEKV
ncbi:MAG: histidinol dehydrogenase, partial [Nitrospinota bacterium]